MISVTLPVKPQPRQSIRAMYDRKSKRVRTFDPQSKLLTELRSRVVISLLNQGLEDATYEADIPLVVEIACNFKVPKSWTKKRTEDALEGRELHIYVPDCDNMAKLYLDAAKGIMFADDRQVVKLVVKKSYALEEGVRITCWPMEK